MPLLRTKQGNPTNACWFVFEDDLFIADEPRNPTPLGKNCCHPSTDCSLHNFFFVYNAPQVAKGLNIFHHITRCLSNFYADEYPNDAAQPTPCVRGTGIVIASSFRNRLAPGQRLWIHFPDSMHNTEFTHTPLPYTQQGAFPDAIFETHSFPETGIIVFPNLTLRPLLSKALFKSLNCSCTYFIVRSRSST